jgi:aquaporin Z
MSLIKKAIAECIGPFVLVFAACGAAAFLNNAVGAAFAFGLVIVAMAYSIGRISGCHINPAVSLGCLLAKRMSVVEFFVYIAAQVVGGFLGGLAVFGLVKLAGIDLAGNALANNFVIGGAAVDMNAGNIIASIVAELILTFIFVYVILNVTASDSKVGDKAGVLIGLTLTLVHLVCIPFTGTSVNPARSLATAFGSLIFGGANSGDALAQVWIFIVGPLAGAALAALIYKLLHKEEKAEEPKAE